MHMYATATIAEAVAIVCLGSRIHVYQRAAVVIIIIVILVMKYNIYIAPYSQECSVVLYNTCFYNY